MRFMSDISAPKKTLHSGPDPGHLRRYGHQMVTRTDAQHLRPVREPVHAPKREVTQSGSDLPKRGGSFDPRPRIVSVKLV